MKVSLSLKLLLSLLVLVAVGCANPASDAPEAEVQEAAPAASVQEEATEGVEYALGGKIEFVGSKVTGSHDGGFRAFEGTVRVTDGTVEGSSVRVTIDTTSLWSDNERLTGHLKSEDFFAVETFPTATFESTSLVASEEGGYTMTGNLTLHGVTKQVSFPAEILLSEDGFTAKSEFTLMRFDFGIEYEGKADDLIRDEVLVRLDLASATDMAGDAVGMEEDSGEEAGDGEGEGDEENAGS